MEAKSKMAKKNIYTVDYTEGEKMMEIPGGIYICGNTAIKQ